jgi:hypothetical protein
LINAFAADFDADGTWTQVDRLLGLQVLIAVNINPVFGELNLFDFNNRIAIIHSVRNMLLVLLKLINPILSINNCGSIRILRYVIHQYLHLLLG